MHLHLLGVIVFALMATTPTPIREGIAHTWVGGINLPNRYVSLVAQFDTIDGRTAGTLHFADGDSDTVEIQALRQDNVRFRLTTDDAVYVFSGQVQEGRMAGRLLAESSPDSVFPFTLVPIHRIALEPLEELAGDYAFHDGTRLKIRAVSPGFLRAYDATAGAFFNLYPESATRFFRGAELARPEPKHAHVEFGPDGMTHSQHGQGQRIDPDVPAITWAAEGAIARIMLPDGVPLRLRRVSAGTFAMGDPINARAAETLFGFPSGSAPSMQYPPRPTTLTNDYWLGETEITNAQFQAFADEEAHITQAELEGSGLLWNDGEFELVAGVSWRSPGRKIHPDEPAVMMSWNDAAAFCRWLSARTGRDIRLPTEAEWEYASRATSEGVFGFGSDPGLLKAHAWFEGNANGRPHRVATRKPNAWGFHDMHGNVWEWCLDWNGPFDSEEAVIDPAGPTSGEVRVLRGGSWINGAFDCRSGYRAHDDPDLAEPHFGFRIHAQVTHSDRATPRTQPSSSEGNVPD